MPCGGDATQEREFQPKCARFPYGTLLGRKELPCKSAWTRTRSVASSGRPLAKSPHALPGGADLIARESRLSLGGISGNRTGIWECGPAPAQHPELLPVSISDGATCKRLCRTTHTTGHTMGIRRDIGVSPGRRTNMTPIHAPVLPDPK